MLVRDLDRLLLPIFVVGMISTGQLLFKHAADLLRHNGGQLGVSAVTVVAIALAIYGAATLAWIWILQSFPLTTVYPLMALSFLMVPLGGWLIFGERLSAGYWGGTLLIIGGLVVIFSSGPRP